ncbi:gamma-glutamyl-gamma-aminobutyrate hydrolase family protein [Sporomusa sp.]|uniref:gamma-glutamyl-gamma-aminobutyrate hydrolase family protein n=1 Tax=Sporomusa sp. TaxID=2078658 RepID=UPI002B9464D6|nr:gamma-glutamyl-gamma-aminobutyrate hydrolase family protein [Sporomusa sp.]HWR42723.1 gamma-glutamyl-gamma-aminobutyrate hydrolase family protein [Sporomusa sp.]
MRKPVIGITCNTVLAEGTMLPGMVRAFASTDYIHAVAKAGGVPLLLPPVADPAIARSQVIAIDGLIMSGGPDVDPLLYGEEPLEKLGVVNLCRDEYELLVVKAAAELKKPMLGICRGIQIINVAYGGTLYQDVSQITGCSIKHFQTTAQREALWHTVSIEPQSVLATILGQQAIRVNSYHHQAIKNLAPGFIVTAGSKDGVIEAIELQNEHFVLGVQWHPEMLAEKSPSMLALFEKLVKAAATQI